MQRGAVLNRYKLRRKCVTMSQRKRICHEADLYSPTHVQKVFLTYVFTILTISVRLNRIQMRQNDCNETFLQRSGSSH